MSVDFQYLMKFFPKIYIPKNIIVVIGGIHCIINPLEVVQTGLFDIVCTGQGERTFNILLNRLEHNIPIDKIEGTYFYNKCNNKVTYNPKRMLLTPEELWGVNPDYSLYTEEYFKYPFDGKMVNILLLETARGCPYNCSYCGNSALKEAYKGLGKYVITRPIESSIKTFKTIVAQYNIDICNFVDECFMCHGEEWLRKFGKMYSENIHKPFLIQTRPETVTKENLDILNLFEAQWYQVGMGVESGSKRILYDICNRRTNINDIVRAYNILNDRKIRSNAYFMIGFPTETREEIFETINLCKKIKSTINSVAIFQPLPGQKLTKYCIEKGYITGNEPLQTFTGGSVLKMPQISQEEILGLNRTFLLYAKLPDTYYPEIEKCEKDYENNKKLYEELVELRWKYDKTYIERRT